MSVDERDDAWRRRGMPEGPRSAGHRELALGRLDRPLPSAYYSLTGETLLRPGHAPQRPARVTERPADPRQVAQTLASMGMTPDATPTSRLPRWFKIAHLDDGAWAIVGKQDRVLRRFATPEAVVQVVFEELRHRGVDPEWSEEKCVTVLTTSGRAVSFDFPLTPPAPSARQAPQEVTRTAESSGEPFAMFFLLVFLVLVLGFFAVGAYTVLHDANPHFLPQALAHLGLTLGH